VRGVDFGSKGITVERMRIAIAVLGVFVALFGLLFTLQGIGAVSGSPMSNTTTWSILGPIIALIGIALAFFGWRNRKS
jgi:drug/metabolite transporter superfamily protein YnfA